MADAIQSLEGAFLRSIGVQISHIKPLLKIAIEKERDFYIELNTLSMNSKSLRVAYTEFAQIEDRIYFLFQIEYLQCKNTKEFIALSQGYEGVKVF